MGPAHDGKGGVSHKIQQLLNTLRRPRKNRRPIEEYYLDEDDAGTHPHTLTPSHPHTVSQKEVQINNSFFWILLLHCPQWCVVLFFFHPSLPERPFCPSSSGTHDAASRGRAVREPTRLASQPRGRHSAPQLYSRQTACHLCGGPTREGVRRRHLQ